MNPKQKSALALLTQRPAQVARWLGFSLLTDELHGKWMQDMLLGQEDLTLLAHRGSYKTTCLSYVLAARLIVYPAENTIFFRKGDDDVIEIIKQVRRIIEHTVMQQLTESLYGESVKLLRASSYEVTTDAYTSPRGAAQLLGIGTGGSITGKHADLIVTDDIVNLRDRASKAERDRVRAVYQELQNIRNRGGRIINTGTPWHKEDAISIMPNVRRFDCYQTGLITPEKLEALKRSMAPSLFAANYELKHIAAENALFDTYPDTTDDADLLRDGIAHIDAAYGGEDYTALTCARYDGGKIYLYGRLWQRHVDTVLDAALAECDRLMCAPIYCETNGDKGYLGKEIRRRGCTPRPYAEKMNKYVKVSSYLKKWWGNVVVLDGTDQAYIDQIMNYTGDAEHDDAPDSAACVCRVIDAMARRQEE